MIQSTSPSAGTDRKPSAILALICASIIRAYDRSWLSAPVAAFAARTQVSTERLSRLKSLLLPAFHQRVDEAIRRGRPPLAKDGLTDEQRIAALIALLEVSRAVRGQTAPSRLQRDALVAAAKRLKTEHGITQDEFCRLLGIPERTFRYWAKMLKDGKRNGEQCDAPKTVPTKAPRRNRNEGRFDLEHTMQGVQVMADTTDWELFGVKLKVVGIQDPGARDERLWEGFGIDTTETSEFIIKTLKEVLENPENIQIITDQGRPYLAAAAREAYLEAGLEHEPTKEYTPTEKAPVERSFGVVKNALRHLADLTNRLVEVVPALRNIELASSVGRLLLTTFLSVYAAAARVRPALQRNADADRQTVAAIIEEQRDMARADDRSRRLLLERIHADYAMEGSRDRFVNTHRRAALEDIQEADRRLRSGVYACRCHTKCCDRYFGAILRNVAEVGKLRRRRVRDELLKNAERRREIEAIATREAQLAGQPRENILVALDELRIQWNDSSAGLVAAGRGPARGRLMKGLRAMFAVEPLPEDAASSTWSLWLVNQSCPTAPVFRAVHNVFVAALAEVSRERRLTPNVNPDNTPSESEPVSERSSPLDDLRNNPANAAGS